ncbi:MAG: TldD/PmbA family protein [Butyrivibrio sp.]|nr:TldD/PmbA family protein [Butyrivibrio sp.]
MTEKIIELLKSSGVDGWEVVDKVTEAWEFYFIKHELDQNRVRDVEHISIEVFRKLEDGKFLGSASEEIAPTATEAEAKKLIEDLYERAAFVKNPYYELGKKSEVLKNQDFDPKKMAQDFIEALAEVPETSTEYINSYEIFAEKIKKRFVNSEGVDMTVTYPSSTVEVVVNAKNEEHEIELYNMYNSGTCDKEALKKEIALSLKYGKDRLHTVPTPAIKKAPLVLSTKDTVMVGQWAAMKMHVAMVFRKMSNWEIGKPICDDVKGDTFTMKSVKELPNSSKNIGMDSEGNVVRDMDIIKDNVPQNYWGDRQFGYYMGIKDIFMPNNFELEGGKSSEEELRQGTFLEVVEFSDFSVDNFTGDIAGEIRLGYWHDGDKVAVVSGGSVSGSLPELIKDIRFSKEQKQYDSYVLPAVIRIADVTIAGVE